MKMVQQFYCDCDLCGHKFPFSNGKYYGKKIANWDMMLCDICRKANWDGIVPETYPGFVRKLHALGIEVKLNDKGWIDIPL
jgi:hypothetical protein